MRGVKSRMSAYEGSGFRMEFRVSGWRRDRAARRGTALEHSRTFNFDLKRG